MLHRQARIREHEQQVFSSLPCGLLIPGADVPSPKVLAKTEYQYRREGKSHVQAPQPHEHPHRKRVHNHCAPLSDEQIMTKLFPTGGLSDPARVVRTAEMMSQQPRAENYSPQKPVAHGRRCFPELRAFQEARSRSNKGDASLMVTGVKKVEAPIRSASCEPVPGFRGMMAAEEHRTGTKKVVPFSQPWDPLGLKEKFHSGGHPMMYSGQP